MEKYITVEAMSAQWLSDKVNEKIEQGYVSHGSMCVVVKSAYTTEFYQPMILKEYSVREVV